MSQRKNAPYNDRVHVDGVTIEYEGHDVLRKSYDHNPKNEDQPEHFPSGELTQNGKFIQAINETKKGKRDPEKVRVYEKIMSGVWTFKGYFDLIDYEIHEHNGRNVFRFLLRLCDNQEINIATSNKELKHDRLIPSIVKMEVWKRDEGKCVICGTNNNLHFDHDLPFSKGGTSLTVKNVRLLCMKHNLEKSAKIL